MIKSFKCKDTEKLFQRKRVLRFRPFEKSALNKLRILHRAASTRDLMVIPSLRLKKLKGERSYQYSIRINDQWRICFEWREDGVYGVEIVDYH